MKSKIIILLIIQFLVISCSNEKKNSAKVNFTPGDLWIENKVLFKLQTNYIENNDNLLRLYCDSSPLISMSDDGKRVYIIRKTKIKILEGKIVNEREKPDEKDNSTQILKFYCMGDGGQISSDIMFSQYIDITKIENKTEDSFLLYYSYKKLTQPPYELTRYKIGDLSLETISYPDGHTNNELWEIMNKYR